MANQTNQMHFSIKQLDKDMHTIFVTVDNLRILYMKLPT